MLSLKIRINRKKRKNNPVAQAYKRKDGTVVKDERHIDNHFKINLKDLVWLIGGIVSIVVTFTFMQAKVEAQDEKNKVLFQKSGEAQELAKKHETMFPFIQAQLTGLESGQKKMEYKFDKLMESNNQILRAVKQ